MKKYSILLLFLMLLPFQKSAKAQIDAGILQYPDVSDKYITFEYADDIWIVPKEGGVANKLSSPKGTEMFPKFSPDGSQIAFSGNYEGNLDVYVIPTRGGMPKRITHQGMPDRIVDWYADGKSLLYASSMESGKQRWDQFYKVSVDGGMPEKLPLPYAEFGSFSPDGNKIAFTTKSRVFRTWKGYRGGWAPDIYIYDLKNNTCENITNNPANDELPMWKGDKIYFLSDRGKNGRYNIWSYNVNTKAFNQITNFDGYDVHFPSMGPSDIVFEDAGKLYLLDLATEKYHEVKIEVVTDESTLMTRTENASKYIQNVWISPEGKRALFEARGDIFSVPAENGNIIDLTNTSGYAERFPAWSPDGKWIAYFSDRSGEYELTLKEYNKPTEEKKLTSYGKGYRYQPYWSPDSKKIAFVDKAMKIYIYDVDKDKTTEVDQAKYLFEGGLESYKVSWSSDSRYMAYYREVDNTHDAIFVYDTKEGKSQQLTSGYYNDAQPVFDPDNKYLYYLTNRDFKPLYSDIDNAFIYPNTTQIAAVPLTSEIASPLAPKNDSVEVKADKDTTKSDSTKEGKKEKSKKEDNSKEVKIDFASFEQRAVILPPAPGNITNLEAVSGKVIYHRLPNTGSADKNKPVMYYDLDKRDENTITGDADVYMVSQNGKKMLIGKNGSYFIVNVDKEQKLDKKMPTDEMEISVTPREEWRQIFNDVWRFERDFFYDPNMHGVDWNAMKERYGKLIDYGVTRSDVNYIIGELISELNSSHTYRGGGDLETPEMRSVGYLGVDWELANGAYRIKKIIKGAEWDVNDKSPLEAPGVNVKEGDYVLAVNGVPIDTKKDPWAAFQGLAGKTIQLTVNSKPTMDGARNVYVEAMRDETGLRNLAWVESNREKVDKESDGKIGYIYVPDTGIEGQTELEREFNAQFDKQALIIDERFNNGGQIPDRFVELLNRRVLSYYAVRDGHPWQWPQVANFGPKVMLINGWSGSGGDAFPYYFKVSGTGTLIGTRTWGGLIGISGAPRLIDNGTVTVPTFRLYTADGKWFPEGHGVDPDIEVENNPAELAKGDDQQLEKGIQFLMDKLKNHPTVEPNHPAYQDRAVK